MNHTVRIATPVRLHFGLLSFGQNEGPQFGGVGMMVSPPGIELRISSSEEFQVHGPLAERAGACVERLVDQWNLSGLPACSIQTINLPPHHTGLGVGTQVNLAIAAGMNHFLHREEISASELALAAGRGQRSAVGTHGFLSGGLIVDRGKRADQPLGTLAERHSVPNEWRIVLIRTCAAVGMADERERQAFAELPPVPLATTEKLWSIVKSEMLPALATADCPAFGEAIYQYGRSAGECFSTVQGGAFVSPAVEKMVASIRDLGVTGVGQSSWGPTVLAIVENQQAAKRLVDQLRTEQAGDIAEITIASPDNIGAVVHSF